MVASTQILPFTTNAAGGGGNRLSPTAYAALTTLLADGFQAGIAQSVQINTVLAQASFMSAALANFLVSQGITQNDDGNLAGAVTNIANAFKTLVGAPNVFTGGTTTGSANAQVLATVIPASGFALNNGFTVIATAGFTNTGSTTMNIAGSGVETVQKLSGSTLVNLTGGEIILSDNFSITWNSTAGVWVLQTTPPLGAIAYLNLGYGLLNDGSGNAAINPTALATIGNSSNAKTTIASASAMATFTADEVIVGTALGGSIQKLSSYSQSVNLSTTGAGGMDTGSAPASGYVAIYAIEKPAAGGTSILACAVATSSGTIYSGANMPSGYTYSALIGILPTNGSSQFQPGYMLAKEFFWQTKVSILASVTAVSSFTSQSISAAIPPSAKTCSGQLSSTTTGGTTLPAVASDANGTAIQQGGGTNGGSIGYAQFYLSFRQLPIITSQTLWWLIGQTATIQANLTINSYTF